MKGALPKQNDNLRDEPFSNAHEEESKGPRNTAGDQGTAGNQATGAGQEGANQTSASKEPVMGLDSNNNNNQSKVPLKTID